MTGTLIRKGNLDIHTHTHTHTHTNNAKTQGGQGGRPQAETNPADNLFLVNEPPEL